MSTLGGSCTHRTGFAFCTTRIFGMYTFSSAGHITSWCCYVNESGAGNARLKVFRDDGTNWVLVGQSDLTAVNVGLNSGLSADIIVQSGDYLGIYFDCTAYGEGDSGSNTVYNHSGDVTNTTLKGSWNTDTNWGDVSVQTTYTVLVTDIYIDINKADNSLDGSSWANAKKTMKAGWDLLAPTGTMHVASGDYSGQTGITYNKSWKLSPEDPNNTGAKNVKIAPSV